MNRLKDNEEYLTCRYDTRQSFCGKAVVEDIYNDNSVICLYSYGTEVASIEKYKNGLTIYYYNGKYSQTTTRHQKEFFKQNGLNDKEIKELFDKGELIKND